jgi:aldoxime dehydratase
METENDVSGMPENWVPPYPAWSANPRSERTTIAYLAAQHHARSAALAGLSTIRTFLEQGECPYHVDYAVSAMKDGTTDAFAVAYFNGPQHFHAWARQSGFEDWWRSDERLTEECGYWQERLTLPSERLETLHSSAVPDGCAHAVALQGPVREHAYWGGMRDRISLSRSDTLESPKRDLLARVDVERAKRVLVEVPLNLCIIRSGQDLSDAAAEEQAVYLDVVRPNLVSGMEFLAEQGLDIGCAASRYAVEITPDGTELPRTFGNCLFLSMKHLEDWSKSHPTHLAIFASFFKLLKMRDYQLGLRLWHEVVVLPAEGQHFEYLNCHPRTGLSGLFQQSTKTKAKKDL